MQFDEAKQEIRQNAAKYLTKAKHGNSYICPICGSGSGNKGTGITTKDGVHFTCWVGCFSNADIIDIIGQKNGCTEYVDKLKAAAQEFNISIDDNSFSRREHNYTKTAQKPTPKPAPVQAKVDDLTEYFKACAGRIESVPYLKNRGISDATARRFLLGYDNFYNKGTGGNVWTALIIPTSRGTYVARNTDSKADKGDRYRKNGASCLYNLKAFSEGRPVFIVEGELDCLSIEELGYKAVALGSTSNSSQLIEFLKEHKPVNYLLVALDKDDAGNKAGHELYQQLSDINIECYEVDIYGDHKDANECLVSQRETFTEALMHAERIKAEIAEQELKDYEDTFADQKMMRFFSSIADREDNDPIPTGFPNLDALLDGGLYAGLYVVGAVSSLGKTTFSLQVADQIAARNITLPEEKEPTDLLIFSLEMNDEEIMSKSLSRHTMLKSIEHFNNTNFAKSTRAIMTGKRWKEYGDRQMEILYEAADEYYKYAKYIKIVVGIGDVGVTQIREAIQKHINMTGHKPVVVVDYLQILAPCLERATDKQNTDKAVLELKKMSRDFNIPILAISSFNRENYTAPVNMAAFKETGAVEYSCDVAIALQYYGMDYQDGESEKARDVRIRQMTQDNIGAAKAGRAQRIQLKVLKNRNGSKGDSIMEFYPMYNYFKDIPGYTSANCQPSSTKK